MTELSLHSNSTGKTKERCLSVSLLAVILSGPSFVTFGKLFVFSVIQTTHLCNGNNTGSLADVGRTELMQGKHRERVPGRSKYKVSDVG